MKGSQKVVKYPKVIIPNIEIQSSIIFCEDCKEEITTVMEHLKSYSLTYIILQPIGKQFEDHLDHNVCILTPFEDVDIEGRKQ